MNTNIESQKQEYDDYMNINTILPELKEQDKEETLQKIYEYIENNIGVEKFCEQKTVITVTAKTKDKQQYQIKIKAIFFENQIKFCLTFNNIAQEKELIEKEENVMLQQKLFQSLSHKIKTPLNNILPRVEMCLEDHECKTHLKEKYLKYIFSAAWTLKSFIQDIVCYFQIQNQQFILQNSSINLNELFESLTQQFKPALEEKKLTFTQNFQIVQVIQISLQILKLQDKFQLIQLQILLNFHMLTHQKLYSRLKKWKRLIVIMQSLLLLMNKWVDHRKSKVCFAVYSNIQYLILISTKRRTQQIYCQDQELANFQLSNRRSSRWNKFFIRGKQTCFLLFSS